jgi:sugar transferase EpsL
MTLPDPPAVPRPTFYAAYVKRGGDLLAAGALVVLLAPIMAVVALAVWLVLGRPVLYREERAGLGGRPIRIAKFRSMRVATDGDGRPLPDGERLGRFGRILRRTSLDELPQLFSVLWGDMSLVGPRPLPLRYVDRYSPRQATRLTVRPGLTGWAQIHGRNAVDWPRRLEYDAEYVEMLGRRTAPLTDLWIVGATVIQIVWQSVTGRGVSAPGVATMQEFSP